MGKVARALVSVSFYGKLPAPDRLFAWPGVPISPEARLCTVGNLERPLGDFLELCQHEVRRIHLPRKSVNKGIRKSQAPKEPDPRLTSNYYIRIDRRTLVTRSLVPFTSKTSSVLNSVPTVLEALPQGHDLIRWWSRTPPGGHYVVAHRLLLSLCLVAGRECVPGGWPWSRRRAGSCPAPSRGVSCAT